jgi:hypothetical protein
MTSSSPREALSRRRRALAWQSVGAIALGIVSYVLYLIATVVLRSDLPGMSIHIGTIIGAFGLVRVRSAWRLTHRLAEAREIQGLVVASWRDLVDVRFADGSSGRYVLRRVAGGSASASPGAMVTALWCPSEPGTLLIA